MIEMSEETKQTFGGRTLTRGQHVLAKMELGFADLAGNRLPDEIRICMARVSRIANDKQPSFIALNVDKDKSQAIRQMQMRFVESEADLELWTWTWPDPTNPLPECGYRYP